MKKSCEWCLTEFECGRSDQRFCTEKCRSRHRNKKWREQHREEEKARHQKLRDENPGYAAAASKRHYGKTRDKQIAKAREYRINNPDKVVDIRARSYQKNLTTARARVQRYRKANPKRMQVQHHNHTARQRGDLGRVEYEQWIEILEKYGNRCLRCGKSDQEVTLTMDHIIPVSKGGRHHIDNIQPLCISCNSSKKTQILDFRNTGHLPEVRQLHLT